MTPIMEIYRAEREKLEQMLEEMHDPREAVDIVCASMERMRLEYCRTQKEHAHASRLFDVARQSFKSMLAVSGVGVRVLRDEPHTPTAADRLTALMPMVGIVLGAVLTVWMLMEDLYAPAVLAGVLSALAWVEAQVVYRRRIAVSAVARTNRHDLLRVLDRVMEALEDAVDQQAQQNRRERLEAAGDHALPRERLGEALLEGIQMLLEADQSKDGEYALKAMPKIRDALQQQGIEPMLYDAQHEQYFDMYPAEEGGITIRPALMKDGKLLMRGQATERM